MPYKPSYVANSFLYRAKHEGVDIDHLKLQKLIYLFHGWYLATRGEPAVAEPFEAWPYGPVLSSIYQRFKWSGSKPIHVYTKDIDPGTGEPRALMVNLGNKDFHDVFDRVWDRYKEFSGLYLSRLTHSADSPWAKTRKRRDTYISDEEIKEHFQSIAA